MLYPTSYTRSPATNRPRNTAPELYGARDTQPHKASAYATRTVLDLAYYQVEQAGKLKQDLCFEARQTARDA